MGSELLESDPDVYGRYLSLAEAASGMPLRELTLEGPLEELTRTDVAQPALFALSLALTEIARDAGLTPAFVAGHSLGEYTAAVVAGTLSVEDGMRLIAERGRLMAAIQDERPGAMAAVMGLNADTLLELCDAAAEAGSVAIANINTPKQIVVSGEQAGVERLMQLAEIAGAAQVRALRVGAAFHSELMVPVQERLAHASRAVSWHDAEVPIVANHSGQPVAQADEVNGALVTQIASPVRWVDCVETLYAHDVRAALELGPGRVLGGLVKHIRRDLKVHSAGSRAAIEAAAERLLAEPTSA